MPNSTNDKTARDINVPSKNDELRKKLLTLPRPHEAEAEYSVTFELSEIENFIHQHTEQAVLQARIDEQEFMASTFNNKYARTDFGHDKMIDFTREMSKRLESLKGQLTTNPKGEQS